jgi:DNA-binding LytR/AlgR family response regulator
MKTYQITTNRNRIVLNHRTRLNVPINFVVMLIGHINYTTFIMTDGSEQVVARTLKYFEPFLETHGFQRIHRGSIINPTFMNKYCQEASLVTMRNGMKMKVARRKKDAFLVAISNEVLG